MPANERPHLRDLHAEESVSFSVLPLAGFKETHQHLALFVIRQCLDVLLKPCPHGVYSTITTEKTLRVPAPHRGDMV